MSVNSNIPAEASATSSARWGTIVIVLVVVIIAVVVGYVLNQGPALAPQPVNAAVVPVTPGPSGPAGAPGTAGVPANPPKAVPPSGTAQ